MSQEGSRGYIHYFNGIVRFKPGASGDAVLFTNELLKALDNEYMDSDRFNTYKERLHFDKDSLHDIDATKNMDDEDARNFMAEAEVRQIGEQSLQTEIDLVFAKAYGIKKALQQHLLRAISREKNFSTKIKDIINPAEIFEVFGFSAHALNNNYDHIHIFNTEVQPFVRQEQLFSILEGYMQDCITVMNRGAHKTSTDHHQTKIGTLKEGKYVEEDSPGGSRFTNVDSLKNRLSTENLEKFLNEKWHIGTLIPLNESERAIIKKIKGE